MSSKSIKAYAELCFIARKQPNQAEFIAFAFFKIIPKWVEEMSA